MPTFWGGIALQVVGAGICIAVVESLSEKYSHVGGNHLIAMLTAAVVLVWGVTLMLRGLREYFLSDIIAAAKHLTTTAPKPEDSK